MFNTLRKIFGRRPAAPLETSSDEEQYSAPPVPTVTSALPRPNAGRAVRVDAQPPSPSRFAGNLPSSLSLPLKTVIARFPADLMQRVRQIDIGEAEVFVPMQKVLSQISSGAVRLSFGELRQAAPPGTFTAENDRDRTLVELPLQEILLRLNPGVLSRRPAQKHVEVPDDVTGPFGGQSRVFISTKQTKPAAGQPAPQPAARPQAPAGPGNPPLRTGTIMPSPVPLQPISRTPPPPLPSQSTPRVQPSPAPAQPGPRMQPFGTPGQPIFARIRPPVPAQAPAPAPPVSPLAPEPEAEDDQPVFKRNIPAVPAWTPPPAYTPIAPEAVSPPAKGDTEIIQMPNSFRGHPPTVAPITPIAPVPVPEPQLIRFSAPQPVEAEAPELPVAQPAPVVPVAQAAYTPVPAVAAQPPMPSGETRFISVSLDELAQSWPEALRQEITTHGLRGSQVGLPLGAVEGIIKTGKLAFPWKALRAWIRPPIPVYASAYDTTMLELPMKVITPLFMAELKATRTQTRLSVDEEIPDLFFDSRVPETVAAVLAAPPPVVQHAPSLPPPPVFAPAPVAPPVAPPPRAVVPAFPARAETPARPTETNYFVQEEPQEDTAVLRRKPDNTPGTAFFNRYATPNEIVSKAAGLEGVDGALIALPDGLLVASKIPANMNADTIAAFLPQIFGRVSQCTRELRLGELNNLNFTVGNIPWKIFRVGAIYFAAFGRPGVPLPTAQLVGLAAELDRKAK